MLNPNPQNNPTTDDLIPPISLYQDYFTIGGDKSPGKCEIKGASREWEWLELAGAGLDGRSLSLRGGLLPEFDIEVTIATEADLTLWDAFQKKWLNNPVSKLGPGPSPMQVAKLKAANQTLSSLTAQLGQVTQLAASTGADAANAQAGIVAQIQLAQQQQAAAQNTVGSLSTISRALGIFHPRLARVGINSVVVGSLGSGCSRAPAAKPSRFASRNTKRPSSSKRNPTARSPVSRSRCRRAKTRSTKPSTSRHNATPR